MNQFLYKKRTLLGKKGFSLVELIIVIAIMAVLVAILAPQYLKYVDKSRQSADDTTADEILKAAQVAMADEKIATAISGLSGNVTITMNETGTTTTDTTTDKVLEAELTSTLGDKWADKKVTSNSYKNGTTKEHKTFTVTIAYDTGVVSGKWA